MNLSKHVKEIQKNGLTKIPGLISQKKCDYLKNVSLSVINKLKKSKNNLSSHNQVINSPFRYDRGFYHLLYNKKLDLILKKLLDEDYVLINTNIINRKLDISIKTKIREIGDTWHTDSPQIGKRKLYKGIRYIVVILLDQFNKNNSSTLYVPRSHLKNSNPQRYKNYRGKKILGKAGDAIIFDSNLWHKGGESTKNNRVSLFSLYGPWWIKPYFNYEIMLVKKNIKFLNKNLKKILHLYSSPPKNIEERANTVIKV